MTKPDPQSQNRAHNRSIYREVEYRPRTDEPTEPGWYYVRHGKNYLIHPIWWSGPDYRHYYPEPDTYDWFGPVTEVREASSTANAQDGGEAIDTPYLPQDIEDKP